MSFLLAARNHSPVGGFLSTFFCKSSDTYIFVLITKMVLILKHVLYVDCSLKADAVALHVQIAPAHKCNIPSYILF
jgi:hypothetical protein